MSRIRLVGSLMLGTTTLFPLSALGQTIADPVVDEIVVTASRHMQRLADAPVAATVITESIIHDARIETLRQIDDYVPNVKFNQIGQVGGTYITIRGIESNPFIVNRAAVYIDGIPYRQPSDQALGFAEQIEVLRGPQGTLYGANTESGLIVVRTRTPSDRLEAEATGSGYRFTNGEGFNGRLSLAGPLSPDILTGSFVVTHEDADSFVRNDASSIGEPGEVRETFLQGKLRWTPGDRTQVDFVTSASLLRAPGLYEQEFLPIDRTRYDSSYSAAFNSGRKAGRYSLLHDAPKHTREDEYLAGANLNHLFDGAVLDVNASWRDVKDISLGTDLDLTAMPGAAGGHRDDETYWNFEARLASEDGARLQWLVGLNHYRDRRDKALSTLIGPGDLDDYSWAPRQSAWSRDSALFGQAGASLGGGLRLTGGLRYERAEREKRQQAGSLNLGPLGTLAYQAEQLQDTHTALLPRVSLDWKPDADWLLYASVAKGWIPGGFNLAATGLGVAGDYSRYGSERLWTYEMGAKATLLDGKALLGGALFHTDADNWQEYSILYDANGRIVSTTMVTSAAAIRSRGLELELTARPTPELDLMASVGLVDSEYTKGANLQGRKVKLVPEWDASLAASWRPWQGLFLRGEVNGTGRTPLHGDNIAFQDAYWLVNAQVGWESERWTLRLYAENLTKTHYYTTSAYSNSLFGYDGTYYAGVGAPQVIGAELGWRW